MAKEQRRRKWEVIALHRNRGRADYQLIRWSNAATPATGIARALSGAPRGVRESVYSVTVREVT